jgi:hypothetical protein
MRPALLALGQALVDAVSVGMVGDDENAGLGGRSGCKDEDRTGKERRNGSHVAPMNEGAPSFE